jgi:hypothetical protein
MDDLLRRLGCAWQSNDLRGKSMGTGRDAALPKVEGPELSDMMICACCADRTFLGRFRAAQQRESDPLGVDKSPL